ncbi:hypothetical protein MHM84_00975 [Halomonas sp. McH1-25]|uniref:hypothetical protein n=1 Tax=unclassified Halomonas TaxID=2609666 RepID=UPI001EF55467|nr:MULTISPECIES: hypothetical protein [unclassified Halomonas]MCG7598354.1 hypothetical protein [Halomonas sp. McH1-25]MCP1342704.1 hypothetical protein [Halomonas sp. FL8]MCP1362175.1 hypothetical protein [Halomonas sp. BBD45]MCP1364229.1 hypothetical protein [Halomonas sp. BBD48]
MNGMFDERHEKLMSLRFERDDWRRRAEAAERQLREMQRQLEAARQPQTQDMATEA